MGGPPDEGKPYLSGDEPRQLSDGKEPNLTLSTEIDHQVHNLERAQEGLTELA